MYVCIYVRVYVCIYVGIYVCMYVWPDVYDGHLRVRERRARRHHPPSGVADIRLCARLPSRRRRAGASLRNAVFCILTMCMYVCMYVCVCM